MRPSMSEMGSCVPATRCPCWRRSRSASRATSPGPSPRTWPRRTGRERSSWTTCATSGAPTRWASSPRAPREGCGDARRSDQPVDWVDLDVAARVLPGDPRGDGPDLDRVLGPDDFRIAEVPRSARAGPAWRSPTARPRDAPALAREERGCPHRSSPATAWAVGQGFGSRVITVEKMSRLILIVPRSAPIRFAESVQMGTSLATGLPRFRPPPLGCSSAP